MDTWYAKISDAATHYDTSPQIPTQKAEPV